jgi:hypothetical protein
MRRIPFEIWLVALVIGCHLYVFLLPANSLITWFGSDDAFYYFKTAQNITEGYGITFDRIGRSSGFHPLWMIMITPIFTLASRDLILPLRLVAVLSVLLSAGTAVLIYRLAKKALNPRAAAFAGIFWAFFPLIHREVTELGMESGISAFLIALLVYRLAQEEEAERSDPLRWLLTGAIAALTLLARLDNVFLIFIAGIWLVFRQKRLRYLLTTDIVLILLGVVLSYFIRVGFGPQAAQSSNSFYWMAAAAIGIRIAVYYLFGLYASPARRKWGTVWHLAAAVGASILSTVILSAVMLGLFALHLFPSFPRLVLLYEAGFGLAAVIAFRMAAIMLFRDSRQEEPIRWIPTFVRLACYFAPIGLVLAAYMGFNWWYFGTSMPVSGQIKRWWGTLPHTIYGRPAGSLAEILGFFSKGGPWWIIQRLTNFPAWLPEWLRLFIYGGMAAALLLYMRQQARLFRTAHTLALFPLFIGGLIQLLSYTGTGYLHMRGWYWVSQMMLFTLILAMLLDALLRWLDSLRPLSSTAFGMRRLTMLVTIAACGMVLVSGTWDIFRRMPMKLTERQAARYMQNNIQLEAKCEPGSRIGSTGGGVIAYFVQDRTIVNLDGLMNTYEYYQMLKDGRASEYLDRIGLNYIYSVEYGITSSDPYFQFNNRLEKIDSIGSADLFIWK